MRQVFITGHGGPEVLQMRESADPVPVGNEVRVRVKASGVNFADILARKGLYPDAPPKPCVVGYEISGTVDAAGPAAKQEWIGKDVFGLIRFGGYADTVVLPESQVFARPAALSHAQCAAIPVNYLTAWQLLVVVGALTRDESVLIHNAGGGVGLAAIDIARHIGAKSYGTASARKHAFLKERGLDHAIDYRTQDWTKELMRLTDNRGVELVTDPLGGASFKKSYRALRHTGRLGMFGVSDATEGNLPRILAFIKLALSLPLFNPVSLMNDNRCTFGVNMGHMWHEVDKIRLWMQVLLEGVDEGWIRPHVDRSFSLDQIGEAHTYLEERKNTGKVVLAVAS